MVHLARLGEVAGKRAGKAIPSPGGVMNIFERIRRGTEEQVFAKKQTAVLALFNADVFRAEFQDSAARLDEAGFFHQLARLALIEDQAINPLQEFQDCIPRDFEPQIHRIRHNELWFLHLTQHVHLQLRRDIGEENKGGIPILGWQGRIELFEYVERNGQRPPIVHVPFVFAGPAKRRPRRNFEPLKVDAVFPVQVEIGLWKIVTDNADEIHRCKEAGGNGRVAGGSAEEIMMFFERRLDAVESDGTGDE